MLRPLSWWLQERLYLYGYSHRDRCAVVGFNLPFDLGRLASYWAAARGYYRGGWSLGIWGSFDRAGEWHDMRYRQRLLMKAIDPRRTLFGWGSRKKGDEDEKGAAARFIDLRTLAFALTDRSYNLEGACEAFGDPYEKAERRLRPDQPRADRLRARGRPPHLAAVPKHASRARQARRASIFSRTGSTRRPPSARDTSKRWE